MGEAACGRPRPWGGCCMSEAIYGQLGAPRCPLGSTETTPGATGTWEGPRVRAVCGPGPHLAQADGVVEGLGPRVEVHCLPHLLLALVLAGQVIGRSPVPSLVGDLRGLEDPRSLRPMGTRAGLACSVPPAEHSPSGCGPGSSGCAPGRRSPAPARSSAAPRPSLPGSPGTGPTTATESCGQPGGSGPCSAPSPPAPAEGQTRQPLPAGGWGLPPVLHLIDIELQGLQVFGEHPGHLKPVGV